MWINVNVVLFVFYEQQVLDHETYVMNLTEANLSHKKAPLWTQEYTAKVSSRSHLPQGGATLDTAKVSVRSHLPQEGATLDTGVHSQGHTSHKKAPL